MKTKPKKKLKKEVRVKAWTVIWEDKAKKFYGIPKNGNDVILLDDTNHNIKFNVSNKKIGRPKIMFADVYPFFDTEKEAEAYREGNNDFKVVPVTIIYKP